MPNSSIGCKVTECKHHAGTTMLCDLSKIEVVKHEQVARTVNGTDCGSFELAEE